MYFTVWFQYAMGSNVCYGPMDPAERYEQILLFWNSNLNRDLHRDSFYG